MLNNLVDLAGLPRATDASPGRSISFSDVQDEQKRWKEGKNSEAGNGDLKMRAISKNEKRT